MITTEMINKLKAKIEKQEEAQKMTVEEIIDDIIKSHHEKERRAMDAILEKIKEYESKKKVVDDEKLMGIFGTFRRMSVELARHFEKEEYEVFPIMKAGENSQDLFMKISELEDEHGKTEGYIADITKDSEFFSYKEKDKKLMGIYEKMKALFVDISEHEGKEDGVLFPKFEV
ncbi:Iron-sulfur cluster repair protein YtfE, RIC family, contains ScdAN and hemerythrin domains [Lachnospiraceae bacterium C7]|nr:Iron-sulfur cluster repair protein YtfE, RIC family, contains ScdAN and hemerythrin domains [Lachnospiraceae bacterium C7]